MNTLTRSLIGVSALGGVVGVGYFASNYFSSDNIGSKLKANKYELLGQEESNNSIWTEILGNYKIVAGKNEKYKFDDFLGTDPTSGKPSALDTLKQKCWDTLNKNLTDDKENSLYEKAKKWCIKPKTISELLDKEFVALKTDVNNADEEKADWTKKVKDHKDPKNNNRKIAELELNTNADDSQLDEDIKKIKQKCQSIGETKNHADGFEDLQNKFKDWCSNKKDQE